MRRQTITVTMQHHAVKFMQLVFVLCWCYGAVTKAQNTGKFYKDLNVGLY